MSQSGWRSKADPAWYRSWNQFAYLSPSERRLNRGLWLLLLVALGFALAQHVVLADVDECFRGGARLGSVLYDLSIAYAGAFTFYALNIRLPLRRDRRNIYQHIGPLVGKIVAHADGLMLSLNRAARIAPADRPYTRENVAETCGAVQLMQTETPDSGFATETGLVNAKVWQVMMARQERTTEAIRELLSFSTYLAPVLVALLTSIERDSHFKNMRDRMTLSKQNPNVISFETLSPFASQIFDYLTLVAALESYATEFFPETFDKMSLLGYNLLHPTLM